MSDIVLDMIPAYIINGFLDSGKTEFINYTLGAPYFRTEGSTLLILCEEGEKEYDEALLRETSTVVKLIDDKDDFTVERLSDLEAEVNPERIIIEWNGMWNFKELELPGNWTREQQITNIDASTFPLYYTNMRSLLAEMIKNSDLIIFNRCDDLDEELASYRRNVKAVNQKAEIIFEDAQGEVSAIFEDELPYDLEADTLELTDDTYGIWYLDMIDHIERYTGKTVIFTARVMKTVKDYGLTQRFFIPGRSVMTCCVDDLAFLGFVCNYDGAEALENEDWVEVRAGVSWGFHPAYGMEGPVLSAISVSGTEAPENEIIGIG